tara:strand:- start:1742 stop:2092 length:351 start_codon:yes stop_codon:yes gene_type:complete
MRSKASEIEKLVKQLVTNFNNTARNFKVGIVYKEENDHSHLSAVLSIGDDYRKIIYHQKLNLLSKTDFDKRKVKYELYRNYLYQCLCVFNGALSAAHVQKLNKEKEDEKETNDTQP